MEEIMKTKKIIAIFLSMIIAISNFGILSYAKEEQPIYEITDEYVMIDSVKYELIDNTIQYNGNIYELQGSTLVTYDEKGPIYLILPVEQNVIKDPKLIEKFYNTLENKNMLRGEIPSNPVSLPYSAEVPEGQWYTETPFFEIIVDDFYRCTELTISNFSTNETLFSLYFMYIDYRGVLVGDRFVTEFDFNRPGNSARFVNLSTSRYGLFQFSNLYGESSFTYTISLSNEFVNI